MDERTGEDTPKDWTFQLNPPTIICIFYVLAYFTGITALVGVILAYVWRRDTADGWQQSHFSYLIRTFWMAVLGLGGSFLIFVVLAGASTARGLPEGPMFGGVLVWMAAACILLILLLVRVALSLVNAQQRRPMPRPKTWLV